MASESSRRSVLVVDDSSFLRRVVCDAIAATPDLSVAGEATDGLDAIRQVHELQPDLVTLDLEMPAMNGLEALGYIMSECPRPVVVLSGQVPVPGSDLTIRALELGAVDFVRKPSWADTLDVETLSRRLLQALREAGKGRVETLVPTIPPRREWRVTPSLAPVTAVPRAQTVPATGIIAIAASTGGPKTLAELLPRIPHELNDAIVIVQHMPAGFTGSLAHRLQELGPRPVQEAQDEMPVLAGYAYVAPGGWHLTVHRDTSGARFRVNGGGAVNGVRPAADVTLATIADTFGARCVALVLTGMGRDGAAGASAVRARGGSVIVQDPDTCVVSGMPQAVMMAGAVDAVLPVSAMPDALRRLCAASRRAT